MTKFDVFVRAVVLFLVIASSMLMLGEAFADEKDLYISWVDEPAESIIPEHWNHNLLIKVSWYDTTEELQEALTARTGVDFSDTEAYSLCEVHYEDGDDIGFCELWLVRPDEVDDYHTTSVGHEVLHGLLGDYHE